MLLKYLEDTKRFILDSSGNYFSFKLYIVITQLSTYTLTLLFYLCENVLPVTFAYMMYVGMWEYAFSHSILSNSLWPYGLQPARILWYFSGKNTGLDCHFLLQGVFLTQGWNLHLLCLLDCRQILYLLSHQGTPANMIH